MINLYFSFLNFFLICLVVKQKIPSLAYLIYANHQQTQLKKQNKMNAHNEQQQNNQSSSCKDNTRDTTKSLSENTESISSRIKTKNGFYQQRTYTLASTNEQRIYKSSITDKEKPDTLQDMICDLEDTSLTKQDRIYNQSIASIKNLNKNLVDESIRTDFESFVIELSKQHYRTANEWRKGMRPFLKKFNKLGQPKKAAMRRIYMNLLRLGKIDKNQDLESYLIAKASRTQSGVMVVTVLTSPYPEV